MNVNKAAVEIPDLWRDASLLSFLRDYLGMTGTKYGCGKGLCGACTVHVDVQAVRSCLTPVGAIQGAEVTTIEGLGIEGPVTQDVDTEDSDNESSDRESLGITGLHAVQQAWLELNVPQCGYCQAGQIMTAAAYLEQEPNPDLTQAKAAMNANLCRCGTYERVAQGVVRAAEIKRVGA